MEKMNLHSPHLVNQNIERIAQLFPNCVTESAEGLKIDFDQLRQELSGDIVEGGKERYRLDWPGKREAIVTSNLPTTSTLRPVRGESVDFDTTENIYIEGDNLEVLKVLQESYLNKVKMIYIDPPYNTGNDFVYRDDFAADVEEWREKEYLNEAGERMVVNPDGAGRYHSDWLSMMYPRLKLARNLLTEDGVIFISIDDNEIHNLRKMCDEIFGEGNFVAQFIWRGGKRNAARLISTSHEYMISYSKNLKYILDNNIDWKEQKYGLEEIYKKEQSLRKAYGKDFTVMSNQLQEWYKSLKDDDPSKDHAHYKWIDSKGVYFASDISRGGGGGPKWSIKNPFSDELVKTPSRGWAYSKLSELEDDIKNNLIHFNGDSVPCKKRYLKDNETQLLETVFYKDRRGASKRLRSLLDGSIFDFPKDELILKNKVESFTNKGDIILDFFSGSATTAHAVMQLNAEDGGNRKYIMVQLPEETDEKSEAYKAGYKTIAEIGKERIRRAAAQIKAEQEEKQKAESNSLFDQQDNDDEQTALDLGFRVYKLDSSNMKDVYYSPASFNQEQLDMFSDNIKDDRTDEDLVAQVMLDWGLPLSLKIEQKEILGTKVYAVADDYLYCCFDRGVNEEFAREVAKNKPLRIVFRDSGFANDTAKENVRQLLRQLTPETQMRVI